MGRCKNLHDSVDSSDAGYMELLGILMYAGDKNIASGVNMEGL